ncbi:MAG: hypothetical protein IJV36_02335 [Prevotella sp.]|nr:hypothetical protein [Prevotella sp.]MBR1789346.1 hypothetical protein [Bacteroidaceae bacterium]
MKPKTINIPLRSLVTLVLCYSVTLVSAQENLEHAFSKFIESKAVTVTKSFSEERDITKANRPLIAKADVYNFMLKAKHKKLLDEVLAAFDKERNNENVYQAMNHTGGRGIPTNARQILVGNDTKNSVYIGMDERENWQVICLIDPADDTRSHRYAYAIEWNENLALAVGGLIRGKLVVTYSRIPTYTLSSQSATSDTQKYFGHVETDSKEIAREATGMVLSGRLDELNADKGQMLLVFDALKTEYCKPENFDSRTGTTLVMAFYAICSHIGNLMKDYPQTDDPDLRELLRSQIDDMIRITNHSSDLGRSHIGYLELAKKALQ